MKCSGIWKSLNFFEFLARNKRDNENLYYIACRTNKLQKMLQYDACMGTIPGKHVVTR